MFDYLLNGQVHGGIARSVAGRLLTNGFDPEVLRPWVGADGRYYCQRMVYNAQTGQKEPQVMLTNAEATLFPDEWKIIDDTVIDVGRKRLQIVRDFRSQNMVRTVDGFAHPVIEYQTAGDVSGAEMSMSGLRKSERDRPQYDVNGLPLPIIHADWSFDAREVAISRNGRRALDTTMLRLKTEKVMIQAEQLVLGLLPAYQYAGYTIYGLLNHPNRNTKVLTDPTDPGWTPATTFQEILAMRQQLVGDFKYGPYVIYNSPAWEDILDDDYSAVKGNDSLRDRIMRINGIGRMQTLDYLTGYTLLMVQMDSSNATLIDGMPLRVLQWTSGDNMELFFKIMMILVPQIFVDQDGNCGIVHGSVP